MRRAEKDMRTAVQGGAAIITGALTVAVPCAAQQLTNDKLSLTVDAQAGSYQLRGRGGQPIFTSRVAAQVNHQWLRSSEYPRHQASESTFTDELGPGRALTVTCTGLEGKADLVYVVQLYYQRPYATVQVTVRNTTGKEVTVQAIRGLEAIEQPVLNLGGHASADRILSDSFSEDWPELTNLRPGEGARRDTSRHRKSTHLQPGEQTKSFPRRADLRPVSDLAPFASFGLWRRYEDWIFQR